MTKVPEKPQVGIVHLRVNPMQSPDWSLAQTLIIRVLVPGCISYITVYGFTNPLSKLPKRKKRRYGKDVYRLESILLTRLLGDREVAKRLLGHARAMYPGRTAKWYLEKVIMDLERDRR